MSKLSIVKIPAFLLAMIGLSGLALAGSQGNVGADAAASPSGLMQTLPAGLRPALYQTLAEDAGPAYAVNKDGCVSLTKQKLKACFDSDGAHFMGATKPLSLHLVAFGRGETLSSVKPVQPVIKDNRVRYHHGGLTEWWRILPGGFEQGFSIAKRAAGQGKLVLELATNDRANKSAHDTLAWGQLRYGALVVTDARGKIVPSSFRTRGKLVQIVVRDADATYPLTVDPLIWLEQKVTPSGSTKPTDVFGIAVAVSGTTAMIGGGLTGAGAVYVFSKSGGAWKQTQKLTANDGVPSDQFGVSVALDGDTAFIGAQQAPFNRSTGNGPGKVYVFTRSNGTWTQTQELTASDGQPFDLFGHEIAAHGNTVFITALFASQGPDAQSSGVAYVFTKAGSNWSQKQKLVPQPLPPFGTEFGASVAFDGTTALIGMQGYGDLCDPACTAGSGLIFTNVNGTWTQTQELTVPPSECGNNFATAVAIQDDTAVIGCPQVLMQDTDVDAAYVFTKSGSGWSETQQLTADEGGPFGEFLALSSPILLVGAPTATIGRNQDQGAAYLFTEANGRWSEAQKLIASDGAAEDSFGNAVALSGSGSNALVGADYVNDARGAAYFYDENNLDLTVSAPQKVAQGGQYINQTIATNDASVSSSALAVSIPVPAAASFVSATASQGNCVPASGIVHCDFGVIAGNAGAARASVTLRARGAGGNSLANDAYVIHATPALSATAATAVNNPPIAYDGTLSARRNKAAQGILQASDANDDSLTFSIVSPPAHGNLKITDVHKGIYTYTPADGYASGDTFSFKANDGYNNSNVATVIINVTNSPPVADDGTLETKENAPASGTLKASDTDGDALTYSIIAPPAHGSVMLDAATGHYTYTPAKGYFGGDGFTFKADDGQSDSNTAAIAITVKGSAPPSPPPPHSGNGGGGSFGGLLLMLLAALAGIAALLRKKAAAQRSPTMETRNALNLIHRRTSMHHFCRVLTRTLAGILALTAVACVTSPGVMAHGSAGQSAHASLTQHDLSDALHSGAPSRLVTMQPQSDLKLLARATELGSHPKNSTIAITVALRLRNVSALKTFLQEVQNPASPVYRHWLTPAEFTAEYGPSKADVAQVVRFLKARGITVKNVSSNRLLIHTEATTKVYEHAFAIQVNDYRLKGRRFYSTGDSPKLPRAIAPLVVNILGLNHGVQMRPLSRMHPLPRIKAEYGSASDPQAAPPPSTAYFNPHQIAKAYDWPDITNPNNGAGVSIAILTAATPDIATNSNYQDFWNAFGLPDHTINVIPIDGESGSGGEDETTLDIEWSGAMAPGATLNVYVAANTLLVTFADMYNQFVTDNSSQVMTTSWGAGESADPDLYLADEQIFMQAAAQGISMFAAAGDDGASDCNPLGYCPPGPNNADFPSSSTYITAANGTELSVSDTSGTYGNEHAWADTGGAISQLFDKPDWQTGPGVPTDISMRMNSDISMNAGGLHPYLVLVNGSQGTGFYDAAGTSAVAPQLAALFAIGVSEQPNGISLGQSNSLLYNDVNANSSNYGTDFHDVTSGCNGYLPDGTTQSCAAVNWDHPTGWGSPKAISLLSHIGSHAPAGTLSGTVTDAAGGAPITGATVTITAPNFSESRTTDDKGDYSVLLLVGDYTVTVKDFGYGNGSASVTIDKDDTVTQDFSLQQAPTATLSGKVTDDSGHGYGLYAEIKASTPGFGQVAHTWTNPETGHYSLKLPEGDYTVYVAAAFDGYQTGTATFTLSGDKTQNFGLKVTDTCTAPGYRFVNGGFSEDFNGSTFPPAGWTVVPAAGTVTWIPSSQAPNFNGNYTGGTGDAADANDYFSGVVHSGYDTSLITPPIPVTSLHGATVLAYKANFQPLTATGQALDLDISTDGGNTWTNVLEWTKQQGQLLATPGVDVSQNLAGILPTSGTFRLRWRFHSTTGFAYYAEIDDVVLGACKTLPGAPIFGQVSAYNTGNGLVGAKVVDENGHGATTLVNTSDPDLPVGTYSLFESAGVHTLTASYPYYTQGSSRITVVNNKIATQNFALMSGLLSAQPEAFSLHVEANNLKTAQFSLANTGSGDSRFKIWAINAPAPASAHATGPFAVAPHYAANQNLSALNATVKTAEPASPTATVNDAAENTVRKPVSSFPAGIAIYGLGVDHGASDLWLGSPSYESGGDDQDHRFLFDGTNTGDAMSVANPNVLYMADMAFDDNTGMFWQLSVDGPNGLTSRIIELDPDTMAPTGKSIPVPSIQSEHGLAYDPLSNTWYAGDFTSETIYHFNASGTLLDSQYVGLRIQGLAYNPTTGHLFVLTSGGNHALYVLGTGKGYPLLSSFDVAGFNPSNAGAGLGYDCNGNLWFSDDINKVVWEVNSGEKGWCAERKVPWLSWTPAAGTVKTGASAKIMLNLDGTGQMKFTTSQAHLVVKSNTPHTVMTIPLTVTWDPQPVNLSLTGNVSPVAPRKDDTLIYTLTVSNLHADNHGAASQVKLNYTLPSGVRYVAASGDATCTPSGGSSSVPSAATGGSPSNTVSCDFGIIALGASKTETLAVKAVVAGKLSSTFEVNAREPESDTDDNHLSLTSEVIGTADLALSTGKAAIPAGGTGTITLTLKNAGPDPASAVQIHAKAGSSAASLRSATASQGSCVIAGGALACKLGQVDADKIVTVTLQLFGAYTGSTTVNAQASTASDEPDTTNNSVTAKVTVKAAPPPDNGGGSGGGALGGLALALLFALSLGVCLRRRYRVR